MDLSAISDKSELFRDVHLGYGDRFGFTKEGSCVITDDAVSGIYGAENYMDGIEKISEFGIRFPDNMRIDGYNLPFDKGSNKAVIVQFSDEDVSDSPLRPMDYETVSNIIKEKYGSFLWVLVCPWMQENDLFSKVFVDICTVSERVTFKKLYGTPYPEPDMLSNVFNGARTKMKKMEKEFIES